ncbi:hypothetical protein PHLGIDRAFT_125915 [Phlebiopsis gigantea 11061_1 CR5-6]|uniref:C-CAP/cofactor C-like domain-containing protein n=1 Tax=Phlebiopsis gigantea (strain 11061_1 CR5-6) TaxID=745531 RepID=A0A0C3SDT7_PHLG1|nr:hypothetical protein PHLGIDRAFT_125915 [Phlebiopsis gigantea 11061_1 CR5-6]
MENTNKALIQHFYTAFQVAQAGLLARVGTLKAQAPPSQDDVNALASDIAKLRKDLSDNTSFLPAYDQRQYEQGLKSLEQLLDELRSSSIGQPKFSFKRKAPKPTSALPLPSVSSTTTQQQEQFSAAVDTTRSSNSVVLSGQTHQYLSWPSVSSLTVSTTDLSISDLDFCVVNFLGDSADAQPLTFTALHVRNVRNTVLVLPFIQGSAMIHGASNSVIVLGCHQFRMHTSLQVDIYLTIDSNPIIEHCSRLRFAQYPSALQHPSWMDVAQQPDDKFAVQDFSHIRATPSPNWTMLPSESRAPPETWRDAAAARNLENFDDDDFLDEVEREHREAAVNFRPTTDHDTSTMHEVPPQSQASYVDAQPSASRSMDLGRASVSNGRPEMNGTTSS